MASPLARIFFFFNVVTQAYFMARSLSDDIYSNDWFVICLSYQVKNVKIIKDKNYNLYFFSYFCIVFSCE